MSENLLLKFKSKDSQYGVTRNTLKVVAENLGLSETMVIHAALAKFAQEVLPAYEMDDGPLSRAELNRVKTVANENLSKGKLVHYKSLV